MKQRMIKRSQSKSLHSRHGWVGFLAVLAMLAATGFGNTPSAQAAEIVVDTLRDEADSTCLDDDCSLRDAIETASNGDTISFEVSGTITLREGRLNVDKDLTIVGPGPGNLTVDGNRSFRIFNVATDVSVEIRDLAIRHGDAGGSVGGGIRNAGELTLKRVTIMDNTARQGGGIFNQGPTLKIEKTTVADNLATGSGRAGGGIFNLGELTLKNSTISGNRGRGDGGGIANGGALVMVHTTIANNAAERGGGIFFDFTVRISVKVNIIKNTIVANSQSGADCAMVQDDVQPTMSTTGTNVDTDGSCPGFRSTSPIGLSLQPLQIQSNSPIAVHALGIESIAIDAVSDCTDIGGNRVSQDQRGIERPQDGNEDGNAQCDVGAFERQAGNDN